MFFVYRCCIIMLSLSFFINFFLQAVICLLLDLQSNEELGSIYRILLKQAAVDGNRSKSIAFRPKDDPIIKDIPCISI